MQLARMLTMAAVVVGAVAQASTATLLYDGSTAFSDLWNSHGSSVYHNVPPHLTGLPLVSWGWVVPAGHKFEWRCPFKTPCDAFLFMYECGECHSRKGTLPAQLNSEGWERSRCAPQFTTGTGSGQLHKMTAYKKIIPGGETEEVVTEEKVDFVSIGVSPTSVNCAGFDSQATCEEASLLGHCQWNLAKETCHLAKCVNYGPSPQGCTSNCVYWDMVV